MHIKGILNSKLIRSASIYTATDVINKAIPFLLLPVLTRYLTPEDYGIVSMFVVLVSFVTQFIGVNIHGAIARIYYDKDRVDIKAYITNCLFILLLSTTLVSLIYFSFSSIIAEITAIPMQILWVVIVVSFGDYLSRVVLTLWQVRVKPMQFGSYLISKTILNTSLSIWFVVLLGLTWQGRIFAKLITAAIFTIIGIIILWKSKWLKFTFNKSYVKHALGFGVPLVPHAVGAIIMTMTDRFFITTMVGIDTTGLYTVGYQIGMIINLFAVSFHKAYVPYLYERLKRNVYVEKIQIVRMTYTFFAALLFLALSLSLVAPWFLSFFVGREFVGSNNFVVWVAFGYAFQGMYLLVSNYILYAQKTQILTWITISIAIFNIVLNYYFISNYGAIGAAQATTIIFFIQFVLTWTLAAKVQKMPWLISSKN